MGQDGAIPPDIQTNVMNIATLTFAAFLVLCTVLLLLPFYPAWREWRKPTDFAPLPITQEEMSNIHYFAERFRDQARHALACTPEPTTGPRSDIYLMTRDGPAPDWAALRMPAVVRGSLEVRARIRCCQPLHIEGDFAVPGGGEFAALSCAGDLVLGPGSRIAQWAHADGRLQLGAGSIALHRVTAGRLIEIRRGVAFCRVKAPIISFGGETKMLVKSCSDHPRQQGVALYPGAQQRTPGIFHVDGDYELLAEGRYEGSLVVAGTLFVGTGASVAGSVKAHRGIVIGCRAAISGAVVCESDIDIGDSAQLGGPVVAESDVRLGRHSRVGTPATPSTITASRVLAEDGAIVHGVVWARDAGVVEA